MHGASCTKQAVFSTLHSARFLSLGTVCVCWCAYLVMCQQGPCAGRLHQRSPERPADLQEPTNTLRVRMSPNCTARVHSTKQPGRLEVSLLERPPCKLCGQPVIAHLHRFCSHCSAAVLLYMWPAPHPTGLPPVRPHLQHKLVIRPLGW